MNSRHFNIDYELSIPEVHARISARKGLNPSYICVVDGNILQMVHKDPAYRKVVDGALFSICDSSWAPLFLKRIYGMQVSQYCGSQIFDDITRRGNCRQYFLGTSDETLAALRSNLSEIDPKIATMKFQPLPFRNVEDFDYEAIAEDVNLDAPEIIWVALGAPKQERFMSMLQPFLKTGVMIGVGAVFNFRSGLGEKRAPQWMIKAHLEWLYRIFRSPRKQIRRCWQIITTFPAIYSEELRRSKK